jgi:hypothetical protein
MKNLIAKTICLVLLFLVIHQMQCFHWGLCHCMLQAPGEQLTMYMDLPVDCEEIHILFWGSGKAIG